MSKAKKQQGYDAQENMDEAAASRQMEADGHPSLPELFPLGAATYPSLAGVATDDLVETIGTGNYSANYINWSRTMQLLRAHAPGWLPELVPAHEGGILHRAPMGGFLLIRFRNGDRVTPAVPQAVMNHRDAAIEWNAITARDITDTHRRGVCMAAAFTFGLAYELWAKLPLESGYQAPDPQERQSEIERVKRALQEAQSLDDLKAHFGAAWQLFDQQARADIKPVYEARKQELEQA